MRTTRSRPTCHAGRVKGGHPSFTGKKSLLYFQKSIFRNPDLELISKIKLVHYDVHGWEPISLAELKRLNQNLTDQLGEAKKWVADTNAPPGGPGEKKAREAVQTAQGRIL